MTTFELYLLLQLPKVGTAGAVLAALGIPTALISGIGAAASDDPEDKAAAARIFRWSCVFGLLGLLVSMLTPSQTTVLALVAYELGGNVEGLSAVPADLVEYLRAMLDQATAEIVGPQ